MKKFQLPTILTITLFLSGQIAAAPPRVGIGINVGVPLYRPYYYPAPCWGPWGPRYYYPYPPAVIYEPAPVIVQPAPVVVRQPAVVVPAAPTPAPAPTTSSVSHKAVNIEGQLQQLRSSDEKIRRDAVMELGRMKADRAVDSLTATLAGDSSPMVRDAAARALGLIAAPRSLTALIHAAQADTDRDVRHSAQFAVEIIRSHLRKD